MSGKQFLKKFFILASGSIFFSPEEKVLVFANFFPAGRKHYYFREAYLKFFLLLLATIFFDFSVISANVSRFFV